MPYRENTFVNKLCSDIVLLAVSSMLINQQTTLNMMSLNGTIHKTRLCIINWGKRDQGLAGI